MDFLGRNDNDEADNDFTLTTVYVQEDQEWVLAFRNDIIDEKTLNR